MLISSSATQSLRSRILSSREVFCRSLFASAKWFVVSGLDLPVMHLIVMLDKDSAEYCCSDLYNLTEGDRVFFLPTSGRKTERNNYKASLEVQRTAALEKILSYKGSEALFVVTYPEALEEAVPRKSKLSKATIRLRKAQSISHPELIAKLGGNGFERVDFVSKPGEFAVRGSIIDIFSFSYNEPYRLSFFGDEIEKITIFDPNTQLSKGECESVEIVADLFSEQEGDMTGSITELLPAGTMVIFDSFDMYKDKPFVSGLEGFRRIHLEEPVGVTVDNAVVFSISPQPVFGKNFEMLSDDIRSRMEEGYTVYIYGEKESQIERLRSILIEEAGLVPRFVTGKNIHAGFIDRDDKVCCYSDHEIFDRFHRVSLRRTVEKSEQLTVNELSAINIGDFVVHIDHGIGVFGGLVRMKDDFGRMKEVVKISYRDGDVVFVSVHALHKISRFTSRDGEPPKVGKLGSKTWTALKNGAKSKVKDIAKDLIKLYARRRASKGFAFSADTYLQDQLESSFMYEDTPDQEAATVAVKHDMEEACPMDRLICGDVGFGKTEVAVRAAFKAVSDSKQVVLLVPTTILALQHYRTFMQRLKDFPCTVDYVSRLRTAKEISQIRKAVAEGSIDILIGTHKVLSDSFEFKDLGLLIIDEEQKFGVAAKEKLRRMREGIDTLTLTATPIPRTLQFSLLGARDLSIINTPPPNRIPIQTEVIHFDEKEIKSIIEYELNRGGQVFFMHNKVEELPSIEDILHRMIPDMRICVAHGKMESRELENRMLDFMNGEYDLLLCTTIIENGLDIPNANTIIINQAQNVGLSDLHQLRGRVGRSNRKAFCYLVVPPLVSITDDARRRLKAIEEFSDLGSGFNIAMQDLDIRGAGNLLGAEQSGYIMDMGFETYQKILAEAMEELGVETGIAGGRPRRTFVADCTVETDQPALIPDDYMDITAEKIRIYKQLDAMTSDKVIDTLLSQMADRFGPPPTEAENLFGVVKLRNLGSSLGFEKVIVKNGLLIAFFVGDPLSPYYKTDVFEGILARINTFPEGKVALKQTDNRLKIVAKGVDSIQNALSLLRKLQ